MLRRKRVGNKEITLTKVPMASGSRPPTFGNFDILQSAFVYLLVIFDFFANDHVGCYCDVDVSITFRNVSVISANEHTMYHG